MSDETHLYIREIPIVAKSSKRDDCWSWKLAKLISGRLVEGEEITVQLMDDDATTLVLDYDADNVVLANQEVGNVVNLTSLTHLNEPSVISILHHRYSISDIYTECGPILLACNPFCSTNHYGEDMIRLYRGASVKDSSIKSKSKGRLPLPRHPDSVQPIIEVQKSSLNESNLSDLPPHVFKTAQAAYQTMIIPPNDYIYYQTSFVSGSPSIKSRKVMGSPVNGRKTMSHNVEASLKNSPGNENSNRILDQSILISGESGAGKTVSTKYILQYLTFMDKDAKGSGSSREEKINGNGLENLIANQDNVSELIIQCNPILESFGNARTIRNDNSSRFGKFIQLHYNQYVDHFETTRGCSPSSSKKVVKRRCKLVGASIETYLLEKSRLIRPSKFERNYHIFYELLSSAVPQQEKELYCLREDDTPEHFRMLNPNKNGGAVYNRRDGIQDKSTFKDLKHSMEVLGFTNDVQLQIFSVVASLLHLSNLDFIEDEEEFAMLDPENEYLIFASELLGVSDEQLNDALCTTFLETIDGVYERRQDVIQATKALEALMKATYSAVFTFLVNLINKSIQIRDFDDTSSICTVTDESIIVPSFIGVLDIFGFESFEKNSFEQLCINYCNEALQQQFNRFVFKTEQEEYEREQIDWTYISFPDNQNVLDLIDAKRNSVLSVLDEQCSLARCTDKTFASAVYEKCNSSERFQASDRQKGRGVFSIIHYAGAVEYSSDSFLEKNKDELPKEATDLLSSSCEPFVQFLSTILSEASDKQVSSKNRRQSSLKQSTVGSQFSLQLRQLREKIDVSTPHYVRCLKPNNELVPDNFVPEMVADQLRCAGVLEAVRVSRVGYPQRYLHKEFFARYRSLNPTKVSNGNIQYSDLCRRLAHGIIPQIIAENNSVSLQSLRQRNPDDLLLSVGIQIGKTKVFLRLVAFETLETMRLRLMRHSATVIASTVRRYLVRSKFMSILQNILSIQCFYRRVQAQVYVRHVRLNRAALVVQTMHRSYTIRRQYESILIVARIIQCLYRGRRARRLFSIKKEEFKAVKIQCAFRRYLNRKFFLKYCRSTLSLQCWCRVVQAKRQFRHLKGEARDLVKIKSERDFLKTENYRLKEDLEKLKMALKTKENSLKLETTPTSLIHATAIGEEVHSSKNICEAKDIEIEKLKLAIESMKSQSVNEFSKNEVNQLKEACFAKDREIEQLKLAIGSMKSQMIKDPAVLAEIAEAKRNDQDENDQVLTLKKTFDGIGKMFSRRENVVSENSDSQIKVSIHYHVLNGSMDEIRDALASCDDLPVEINTGDIQGRTPLHIAVMDDKMEVASLLIEKMAVPNTQDYEGNTPLHYSLNGAMTELLLGASGNPDIPNINGLCALHFSVIRRDIASTSLLVKGGADVNSADDVHWFTPMHLVSQSDKFLSTEFASVHSMVNSVEGPESKCLLAKSLFTSNVDINYQDHDGNSPLHYASVLDEPWAIEMIQLFIENGANVNLQNNRGQTPLLLLSHNVSFWDHNVYLELFRIFFQYNCDPNIPSQSGCLPIHLALYHRNIEVACLLVQYGSSLTAPWNKPDRWEAFWRDTGHNDVIPWEMLEDDESLHRLISCICEPQEPVPPRSNCMQCTVPFGFSLHRHCGHCGRAICPDCSPGALSEEHFSVSFRGNLSFPCKVCIICEGILRARYAKIKQTQHTLTSKSLTSATDNLSFDDEESASNDGSASLVKDSRLDDSDEFLPEETLFTP